MEQLLLGLRACLKVSIYIFDKNDGGVDDNAEVDCTYGQEIRILAAQNQDDDGEEQSKRDIDADDDCGTQLAEEYPLDEEYQYAAKGKVVQDSGRRDTDQFTAIIVRHQPYAGWKGAIGIDFINLGAHASNHVIGVQRSIHDDNCRNDVVLVIAARLAKPWHVADRNFGDILHKNGHAVGLA